MTVIHVVFLFMQCGQVVSATFVPSPSGKNRCDLFVWDGSLPPNTLDTFAPDHSAHSSLCSPHVPDIICASLFQQCVPVPSPVLAARDPEGPSAASHRVEELAVQHRAGTQVAPLPGDAVCSFPRSSFLHALL